ncbi:MAG: V-type ATPase subunit [archaeon]|nr:V-type ATPase subunit [archaeon]
MIFDIEYASARVRVLRSKLLKDTKDLTESKTKDELIAHLENTVYEQMFASKDIDRVEQNFDNDLIKTLEKVISFLPKRYGNDFSRYTLRFDLKNLKILIRGIHAGINSEDIKKDMAEYGEIYEKTKEAAPKDTESLEKFLEDTIWHQAYKEGIINYKKSGLTLELEHELDKKYMSGLEKIETEPVRNFVRTYKQAIDIKTMSRLGEDTTFLFQPKEKQDTIKLYRDLAKEHIDTDILKKLEKNARQCLLADPFGIGLYIEFIFRKEMETLLLKNMLRRVWK